MTNAKVEMIYPAWCSDEVKSLLASICREHQISQRDLFIRALNHPGAQE